MWRCSAVGVVAVLAGSSVGCVGSGPTEPPASVHGPRSPSGNVGPLQSIRCPPGAEHIGAGADIQAAVDASPGGTKFCLRKGTWRVTAPITPKTGDHFIGLYGATLDGSDLRTTDVNQGVFTAHNQDIDNVIIRNLVIRNCPQRAIHAFHDFSEGWVIDHTEIYGCRMGIHHGNSFTITANYVHDNWQYGIGGYQSTGSLIEGNEFSFNAARYESFPGDSAVSKWAQTTNTSVVGNVFHDNYWSAIWFDGQNAVVLIENNVVVNNAGNGIFYEVSGQAIIRRNRVVGSSERNIYLSEAHQTSVYDNVLSGSPQGIALFQDGDRIREGELKNNVVRDNTVVVPSGGQAVSLTCSNMGSEACSTYSTGRANRFQGNQYVVPELGGTWWYWNQNVQTWEGWQAEGQDTAGAIEEKP